jgi:hypothetical protein
MPKAAPPDTEPCRYRPAQRFGLILGVVLLVLVLVTPPPGGLSVAGWHTAGVALLMASWWMTEAIPIEATGLLPLPLFPLLGVLDAPAASEPYANELIFLFMGGFFLAVTMQRWNLHKRIALAIMSRVGTSPNRLVVRRSGEIAGSHRAHVVAEIRRAHPRRLRRDGMFSVREPQHASRTAQRFRGQTTARHRIQIGKGRRCGRGRTTFRARAERDEGLLERRREREVPRSRRLV